jgi:probable rRNA maturation factor
MSAGRPGTALDVIASGPTAEKGPAIELAIVLADDDEVRRLNRDYRGIDKSTNVLSFGDASDGRRRARGEPVILGDVVLARETVAAEAAAQGKSIADHSLHLVIHGILHLLGHVHESDREADAMEALEIDLLARLGVANPYAVRAGTARAASGLSAPNERVVANPTIAQRGRRRIVTAARSQELA